MNSINLNLRLPINIKDKDIWLFKSVIGKSPKAIKHFLSFVQHNGYILSISNITIITRRNTSFKEKIWVIKNFLINWKHIRWFNEESIIAFDELSQEYFHWMLDVLPKVEFSIEKCKAILLPEKFNKTIFKESLSFFPELKIIWFDNKSTCLVKKAIVPKMNLPSGNYHKEILINLRNRFQDELETKVSNPENRHIYVSRGKAKNRKIINEMHLYEVLKKYGFEMVFFEDMSFIDQCTLAYQTEVLIGNHGAGLSNMLFMKPNSSIIEIRRENDDHNNCFFSLANTLNFDYYYFLTNPLNSMQSRNANLEVNLHEFEILLKNVIKKIEFRHE
jgi:capsular polysaccharide biosynthesis protein